MNETPQPSNGSNQPTALDLNATPLPDLVEWRDACQRELDELLNDRRILEAQQRVQAASAAVNAKAAVIVQAAYAENNKTDGDLTRKRDGLVFKGSISKRVQWDQEKLKALASTLPWEAIQKLFKIEFSVGEAVFKNLMPGAVLDALTAARTVKYGDLKVTVSKDAA